MEETDPRLESSVWVGSKRYRAVLTGWHFNWTEVDKTNRDKTTSRWLFSLQKSRGRVCLRMTFTRTLLRGEVGRVIIGPHQHSLKAPTGHGTGITG